MHLLKVYELQKYYFSVFGTYFIARATAFLSQNHNEKQFKMVRTKGYLGDVVILTLGLFSFNTGGLVNALSTTKILLLEAK